MKWNCTFKKYTFLCNISWIKTGVLYLWFYAITIRGLINKWCDCIHVLVIELFPFVYMWSWLTVWCLSYCNMSAGVMSVPSDLVLVACFITVWWTDSHSLYVFTLMGTYQAGPSPTKSHGEVSNTHLMWTEEESLNIYSIAPHINEFSSSWFFFLPMVAYLILLVAVERKL